MHILVFLIPLLLAVSQLIAGEPASCSSYPDDTTFVDLAGDKMDPAALDPIAVRESGSGAVIVYQRR